MLIEVNLGQGCVAASLAKYDCYHTRICRPVGLTDADRTHRLHGVAPQRAIRHAQCRRSGGGA
jgi:hypothetical protein